MCFIYSFLLFRLSIVEIDKEFRRLLIIYWRIIDNFWHNIT